MTCARFVETEAAERYVLGQMTEAEQSAFEEHYFACDECFQSVQALQDLQVVLRSAPAPHATKDEANVPAVPSPSVSFPFSAVETAPPRPAAVPVPISAGRRKTLFSPVTWVGLAAAATVLLGIIVWQRQPEEANSPAVIAKNAPPPTTEQRPPATTPTPAPGTGATTTPSTPAAPATTSPGTPGAGQTTEPAAPATPPRPAFDFGALAMVVPPAYVPLQTRGAESTSQADTFQSAMAKYAAKDYRAAIDGLRPIADADPTDGRTQFFLGVSYLMTNDAASATTALDRAVASADAPFATEAHFYLAKAALREKDLPRAAKELAVAVDQEAGPPGEATRLLRQVRQALAQQQ